MAKKRDHSSKFTADTRHKIITAIKAGNFVSTACKFAGITQNTFTRWMTRGEIASQGDPAELNYDDLDYLAFYEAVVEAEATAEMVAVQNWRSGMGSDWKAARDFLSRRNADRWGAKIEVNVHEIDEKILAILEETANDDDDEDDDDETIIDAEVIEDRMLELPEKTGQENDDRD